MCIRKFCIEVMLRGNELINTSDLTDTGWILNEAPFNVGFRAGRDFKENSDKPVALERTFVMIWVCSLLRLRSRA